jgi:hypothetical protein
MPVCLELRQRQQQGNTHSRSLSLSTITHVRGGSLLHARRGRRGRHVQTRVRMCSLVWGQLMYGTPARHDAHEGAGAQASSMHPPGQ